MTNERSVSTTSTARSAAAAPPPPASPTPWRRVVTLCLAIAAAVTVAVAGFSWPAAQSAPRDVAVSVVAPPPMVESLSAAAEQARPGVFDLTVSSSAEAARADVLEARSDGAIVIGPDGVEIVVATMASPMLSQAVQQLGDMVVAQQAAAAGAAVPQPALTDLAPAPADDPRGAGLAAAMLPLSFGGVVLGVLAVLLVRGTARRIVLVLAAPALSAVGVVGVAHLWLGALDGPVVAEWATAALAMAAIGAAALGAGSLIGRPGLSVVGITVMLLGNPLAGVAGGPQTVPAGWATLGQAIPPGATLTALRSLTALDGAGSAGAYVVLSLWLAAGLALAGLARVWRSRAGRVSAA